MIQPGTRLTRGALFAAAMLGVSTPALAQTTPSTEPTPQPTESPSNPSAVDPNAPALTPPAAPTKADPAPASTAEPTTVFPTMAGPILRLSDLFSVRFGVQLQVWAVAAQDSLPKADGSAGDFAKNIYIRRGRFFLGGGVGKNLNYFILTETSNSGLPALNADGTVTKNFTNFIIEDAFFDYKPSKYVSFQGGLMLPPVTRNILQSTATYWALDIGAVSATNLAGTQTSVLRDTGFQVKLNALDSKLEVRGMVAQGVRVSDGAGRIPGKNDPRLTLYAQYDFLDPEAGYVFNGQYFGRKKVLGLAAAADYQKTGDDNPYFATTATLFAAIPIHGANAKNGDDEFGGQIEYLHFHNGRIPTAQIGKQDDLLVEVGYYNKAAKFSVFGKFEGRFFNSDDLIAPGVKLDTQNTQLFGGGVKYFFAEAYANLTLQYNYTQFPNQPSTSRNSTSVIQLAAQLAYY